MLLKGESFHPFSCFEAQFFIFVSSAEHSFFHYYVLYNQQQYETEAILYEATIAL